MIINFIKNEIRLKNSYRVTDQNPLLIKITTLKINVVMKF